MAYTTINKPSNYFDNKLYTGTGATNSVTGVEFQPDLTWIKNRSGTDWHRLIDAVRGVTKELYSNATNAEVTLAQSLQTFNANGFTLGTQAEVNRNGDNFASWNWKANGAGVANTAGTISSTVSANTTAGFSIVSYTGNATGNSTVGHGLGAVPKFIIVKSRSTVQSWGTLSASFVSAGTPNIVYLNSTAAQATDTNVWGTSASFDSLTFTVGTWDGSNANGTTYIAYCWSEIKGYSKFGKYTGNGSSDGTFVYTGFKPAFVMIKQSSASGEGWFILDNKRETINPMGTLLIANDAGADNTSQNPILDFTSNGFKLRRTWSGVNGSGGTYIYMAFAEQTLVGTNNIPCTAR